MKLLSWLTGSKDRDQVCLEHYDGKKEWIDPRDYQAVKQVEMSYAQSVKNMADHTKVGLYDIM